MNLTTFLIDLGHVVAYYPKLNNITGSVNATIFLCQFIYWQGKQADPHGWIYKTQKEIQEETGLSRREQETARKNLKTKGFLAEKLRGTPAKLHYKLNLTAINNAWDVFINPEKSSMAESAIQECTESSKQVWRNPPYLPYTETTTEITPLKKEEEERILQELIKFEDFIGIKLKGQAHKSIYRKWRKEWGFSEEMVLKAGEIGVLYSKNINLQFIDTILLNWYRKEIKTPQQAENLIEQHKKQQKQKKNNVKDNKSYNPGGINPDEFELFP